MDVIENGFYRHYKGNVYKVIHTGLHTETLEQMVVYEDVSDSTKIWIRPATMWNEVVEVDGKKVKRFEKID